MMRLPHATRGPGHGTLYRHRPGYVPARAVSVSRTTNYACNTAEFLHNVTGCRNSERNR
ncbi:hypothetical protein [Streptomyces sp. NPDC051554]|uniref:hypothetical protein n=1 Tax=Streptomyces sp. NPDC051554 TaxID=3365656 RepID=UPI0037A8F909